MAMPALAGPDLLSRVPRLWGIGQRPPRRYGAESKAAGEEACRWRIAVARGDPLDRERARLGRTPSGGACSRGGARAEAQPSQIPCRESSRDRPGPGRDRASEEPAACDHTPSQVGPYRVVGGSRPSISARRRALPGRRGCRTRGCTGRDPLAGAASGRGRFSRPPSGRAASAGLRTIVVAQGGLCEGIAPGPRARVDELFGPIP